MLYNLTKREAKQSESEVYLIGTGSNYRTEKSTAGLLQKV